MTKAAKTEVAIDAPPSETAPNEGPLNEGIETRTAGTLVDNAIADLEAASLRFNNHPDQSANVRIHRAIKAAKEIKSALPASEAPASAAELAGD